MDHAISKSNNCNNVFLHFKENYPKEIEYDVQEDEEIKIKCGGGPISS